MSINHFSPLDNFRLRFLQMLCECSHHTRCMSHRRLVFGRADDATRAVATVRLIPSPSLPAYMCAQQQHTSATNAPNTTAQCHPVPVLVLEQKLVARRTSYPAHSPKCTCRSDIHLRRLVESTSDLNSLPAVDTSSQAKLHHRRAGMQHHENMNGLCTIPFAMGYSGRSFQFHFKAHQKDGEHCK